MHVMGGGDVGGAKTQIMNTVTGLNRNNDVMLISFRAGPFADEARERGIDVRVIERHNPFRAARTMRDLVDAFKPDIIHCHGGRANLMGAMVRRSRQVPIVTTVHSDYRLDYLGSPLKQYTLGTANAIALRFLDFYQPVADRMARTLIERGFDPERIEKSTTVWILIVRRANLTVWPICGTPTEPRLRTATCCAALPRV